MNQEIKEQWAAALESGEYEQGAGLLCRVQGDGAQQWCCLGVLCDLAAKAGVVAALPSRGQLDGADYIHFGDEAAYLPFGVREWAGLRSRNPNVNVDQYLSQTFGLEFQSSLANCNDAHVPFAEIARLIREQL